MSETIHLRGIRTKGHHGASRGEQDKAQTFVVDLDMEVEALDDALGTTADYRIAVATVQELVAKSSFALVETIAERIASKVLEIPGVGWCRASVHKPRAAERLRIEDVVATAEAGKR